MSHNNSPNRNVGSMPAVPPAILRPSEDNSRVSEDTINKPLLRNSFQSTATVRTNAPAEQKIPERPSDELSSRPNSGRQQAYQQLTAWQPQVRTESPQDMQRDSQDTRPGGPGGVYGRSTSNDYTVYGGIETPTPVNPNQLPGTEGNYFRQPYRRAGTTSVRDTVETGSLKAGRYTPLSNGQKAAKPQSTRTRAHWPDGYETGNDMRADEEISPRPQPKKRSTSVYIVREGGQGGGNSGSPPPDEVLRLPFANFMAGTVRNRGSRSAPRMWSREVFANV